ncbi:BC10 family protein [Listeria monocytogenes]|nr:BC10 family protein [Listeria monocytogenes]
MKFSRFSSRCAIDFFLIAKILKNNPRTILFILRISFFRSIPYFHWNFKMRLYFSSNFFDLFFFPINAPVFAFQTSKSYE